MGKIKLKNVIHLLLFSILLVASSCEKGDSASNLIKQTKNVNDWIQSNMDVVYYWNTEMPQQRNLTLSPPDFYKSLLYQKDDHYSYIAEDYTELLNILSGVQKEAGYDFSLFRKDKDTEDIVGIIDYIKPNSPASATDLKRGDIFASINGTALTVSNYQGMLDKLSAPHTLGVWRDTAYVNIPLDVVTYEENPVFLDTIYDFPMYGTKISYLIYNFFAADNGDNSYTYLKKLNDIFGKFRDENVNELILDLRYNTGGDALVATALASMISNKTSADLFCIDQFNSIVDEQLKTQQGENYNKTYFNDNLPITDKDGKLIEPVTPVNKLPGLTRLYVLTSVNTASASELIINGLRPYMPVILIGDVTYGKNVGMWFIYETDPQKQKDNHWGILPIVLKIFNSENQSDYENGFTPDIPVDEYFTPYPDGSMQYAGLYPLGAFNEFLLEAALTDIGVLQTIVLRSAEKNIGNIRRPLASSLNRAPIRKNMIVPQKIKWNP